MKERLNLIDFQSAQLSFAVDLLRFACDWAEKEGYSDARIENLSGGYRISVACPILTEIEVI